MNEKKHGMWFQMPIKNIISQKDQAISVQFANVKTRLQSVFAKHSLCNSISTVVATCLVDSNWFLTKYWFALLI